MLFADTIKYNITIGHPEIENITDEDIWRSLKDAKADEFIRKMEK